MTTTTTTIAERVAAGAAWLDEHLPGWVQQIDPERLELQDCYLCMLGQLFGEYNDALDAHFDGEEQSATALGFERDVLNDGDDGMHPIHQYRHLTAAWCELIAARRAGAVMSATYRSEGERAYAYGRLLASVADVLDRGASPEARLAHIRRLLDANGIHPGQVDADGQPVPPPHNDDCLACGPFATPRSRP